jgi:hypothetical protein
MQKRTLIFLLLAVSLLSCEENDDLGDSGKVKIKAVDLNNDPLSGAEVRIYSPEENQNGVIFEDSTNASGICNVGKLLPDEYRYMVTARVDNRTYWEVRYFQVIAGERKTIEATPVAYSGTLTFTVTDMQDEIIEGIQVALIPHFRYNDYTYEQMQEEAWYQGTTDSSGEVTFERVPANVKYSNEYSVFIYYDEDNFTYPYKGIYLSKGDHRQITLKVDL